MPAVEDATDVLPFRARLIKALEATPDVPNDSRSDDSDFASMEAVLRAVRGPLFAHGILLTPRPHADFDVTEMSGPIERALRRVEVKVDFEFSDAYSDEKHMIANWPGEGEDLGPHAYAKALTSATRSFVKAQWLLPIGGGGEGPAQRRATYKAPAWAVVAHAETKANALTTMIAVFGHEGTAREWLAQLEMATGGSLTERVGQVVAYLDQWIAAGEAASRNAQTAARIDADVAQAAIEAGDPPTPDPGPDPDPDPGSENAEPEWLDETGAADEPDDEPPPTADGEGIPAGSVKPPHLIKNRVTSLDRLKNAGCICPVPPLYGQKAGDSGVVVDDRCPITGHGLPL